MTRRFQNLRYALRQLRLNPIFALVMIASLALGIGANTAIFQLLDAVRLRNLQDRIGSPAAILSASKDQLLNVPGIGEAAADAITGWQTGVDLAGELRRIREYECHIVTWNEPEYPAHDRWLRPAGLRTSHTGTYLKPENARP